MPVSALDNPLWSSLTTAHAHLALGAGLARRYPADFGPLCGLCDQTEAAYADLHALLAPRELAVLFLEVDPEPPAGWKVVRRAEMVQMICPEVLPQAAHELPIALGPADYPEMIALAQLTEPGPFRERTAELGQFFGFRTDGRLAAMAGQRSAPTGHVEVSAVCTHPDFRGRGLAQVLVAAVAQATLRTGSVPILHSLASNAGAIRVYKRVGFTVRRPLALAVLQRV